MLCGVAFISTLAGSIAAVFLGSEDRDAHAIMRQQVAELHGQLIEKEADSTQADLGIGE
jgi:hypothetical protein